jgi:tetratricopeptide (TPR) repeat protein
METLAAVAAGGGVVGICAIDGMAGIGKTTFAVHAAHQLAGSFPDGQFFLPLHAHTAGQRPVGPAEALGSLLLTAGLAPQQIPPGLEARAARWRGQVAGRKILLVLDDAAGHEQVRPLLPGTAGSLVLVTSRRRLTALADTAVITLEPLPPAQAAALLARLAARAGIGATDPAVGEITRLCGYLPLAIGMLAAQLRHHPAWTLAALAADLAAARDRLALMRAENLSVAAVFGLSYADLAPGPQRLFRRLGLIPGPTFDTYTAAALDDTTLDIARRSLEGLYDQHLLTEPARGRYQLHDLLREHARTLTTADDPAECSAAIERLLDYYLHTALVASRQIPSANPNLDGLPPARSPRCAPVISTPGQAAAWLDAERANLYAAADYAATNELSGHATLIPAAMASFLAVRGYWDQAIALHQTALAAAARADDRPGQAQALMLLSDIYILASDSAAATATAEQALELFRDLGDRAGQGDTLNSLGLVQQVTGHYQAAAASHQQALELFRDLSDQHGQSDALSNLSELYCLTGNYPAARACAEQALELRRDPANRRDRAFALTELSTVQRLVGDYSVARSCAEQALELFGDLGDLYGQAYALRELGTLQRLDGDYPAAATSQQRALELCRDLSDRDGEGHALNELGLIQQLTHDYDAAAASHHRALQLFRDLSDPHGQAEALNSLGELAAQTSATHQARDLHSQACAIARDVGLPFDEARAREGLGRAHLQDGDFGEAATHLGRALSIYRHIGAHPAARHVQDTLRQYALKPGSPPSSH